MSGDQERLDPHFSYRPGLDSTGEERFEVVIGAVGPLNGTNCVQFRVGQAHRERPTGDSPEDNSGRGVPPSRSTGHDLLSPHGAGR
ncbi:hypothetical protein AB0N62_12660 [Streptomyces sp. NPDC093982]|uniref:hypothetical protein n=1 Tax=Streptomyces sp. NPDC093982 TaxID=3155077 RepID=UPI00341381ED